MSPSLLEGAKWTRKERDYGFPKRERLPTAWFDLHINDAVCTSLYSIAYDSDKTTRIQILKRARKNLKVELSRLDTKMMEEGSQFMNDNYILKHAREAGLFLVVSVFFLYT